MELNGKTAVVTGAARGIGKTIALELSRRGVGVALIDIDAGETSLAAEEVSRAGSPANAYRCNVASFEEVSELSDRVAKEMGSIDYLINNAGIVRDRLLMRMTLDDWNSVLSVNLTGAFNFCKAFAPQMLKRRFGRIVNISSVIGLLGNAGQANYAASKAGVIGLTKSLAREFASREVTVNAVAPGFISTPMTEKLSDEVREGMMRAIPLQRFGEARDVANVVIFLLSEAASYITGQVIHCDGGMVMAS